MRRGPTPRTLRPSGEDRDSEYANENATKLVLAYDVEHCVLERWKRYGRYGAVVARPRSRQAVVLQQIPDPIKMRFVSYPIIVYHRLKPDRI